MLSTLRPSESAIQSTYIKWLRIQHPAVSEVTASFANGGKRTGRYGKRLKREGLKVGFPDIGMFVAKDKHPGLFIEFKDDEGVVSKEQKYIMSVLGAQGYTCAVCRSLEQAIGVTESYLRKLNII
jgi:hypothetical protein